MAFPAEASKNWIEKRCPQPPFQNVWLVQTKLTKWDVVFLPLNAKLGPCPSQPFDTFQMITLMFHFPMPYWLLSLSIRNHVILWSKWPSEFSNFCTIPSLAENCYATWGSATSNWLLDFRKEKETFSGAERLQCNVIIKKWSLEVTRRPFTGLSVMQCTNLNNWY